MQQHASLRHPNQPLSKPETHIGTGGGSQQHNPSGQPFSSRNKEQQPLQSNPHAPAMSGLSGPLAALPAATQASLLALFSSACFNADPATLASLLPLLLPGASAQLVPPSVVGHTGLQSLSQAVGNLHAHQDGTSQGVSVGRWVWSGVVC